MTGTVAFIDEGGHLWTAEVDYNDGNSPVTLTNITPSSGIPLTYTYHDNGTYTISITLTNDDGQSVSQNFTIDVKNVAPTATYQITGSLLEGSYATVAMTGSDSSSDQGTLRYIITTNKGTKDAATYESLQGTSSPSQSFFLPDDPLVIVYMRVIDKDGGYTDYDHTINVTNDAPTPSISDISVPRVKGGEIRFTGTATDPAGANDTIQYKYVVFNGSDVVVTRDFATVNTFAFTPDSIGEFRVELTAKDEDGGEAMVSQTFTVAGESNLSVAISSGDTFGGVSNQELKFGFAVTSSNAPNSYSFLLRWGDGNQTEFSSPNPINHKSLTYKNPGVYEVVVTVTDQYGLRATGNFTRTVHSLEKQGDDWYVGGTLRSDAIEILATTTNKTFDVHLNRSKLTTVPIDLTSAGKLIVLAGEVRDIIAIRGSDAADTFVVTGSGVTLNGVLIDLDAFEIQELHGEKGDDRFEFQHVTGVKLVGGDGEDTIVGPARSAAESLVWEIQAAASGYLHNVGSFSSIERLSGGSSDDHFMFRAGGSVKFLDGGEGINTLDYSKSRVGVTVDLAANTAIASQVDSLVGNSVSLVIGSNYNDVLKGRKNLSTLLSGGFEDDTLQGGTAADILLGGMGVDTIYGYAGQDILIGGRVTYESQVLGLMKIFEEWTRTDTNYANRFNDRVRNLSAVSNSGKNGDFILKTSGSDRTVVDDRVADRLFGGADSDWLFGLSNETRDFNSKEDRRSQ